MREASLIAWRSFLDSEGVTSPSGVTSLNKELCAELFGVEVIPLEKVRACPPVEDCLNDVHYSWFSPFLRTLPEREIKLFLACLTPGQIRGLKQALLLSNTIPQILPVGRDYLKRTLLRSIAKQEIVPIDLLPQDPLNQLLHLSYDQLLSSIELMSMHDLSLEIRHIIDTTRLKSIYSHLTKAQTNFLKTLLHKKESIAFKKMQLSHWQGDDETLSAMLTQRGINRIAKALYPKHSDLLWHVAHRLDAERGELLLKLCTPLDHPKAATLLEEQVVELAQAIKPS
jgi:hypothetical protein